MKLIARLLPWGDESRRLLEERVPAAAGGVKSARWPIDTDEPVLREILKAGDTLGSGFRVGGEAVFSRSELAAITHFELACRCIVRESEADFTANDAVRERTPLVDAGGHAPIRLMSGLSLSHIQLKPNMVGSVGDSSAEYVAASGVVHAFRDAGLTGVTFETLTHTKTGVAHERYFQLFSRAVLTPAIVDDSVERIESRVVEEHGHLRHLGNLAYAADALRDRPDFNRTAEPWAGWHGWPSWVVSARVREVFTSWKFRGWHFRPVLSTESDMYAEYAAKWKNVRDAVGATRRSKVDGGRW